MSVGKWMSSQLNAMPTWAKVSVGIGLTAIGVGISVFSGGALTPAVATAAEVLLGGTALGMVGGASAEFGNQMQAGNGYSGQKIWEASVNGGYNGMAMSGPAAGVQGFTAGTSTSLPSLTDVGKMPDEAFKESGNGNGTGGKLQEALDIADNYKLSNDTFNNHILDRHGSNSAYKNKSQFNVGFDIRNGINSALKGDNFVVKPNTAGRKGYIFEQSFASSIGTSARGELLHTLKVIVDEAGNVVTAFPIK